MSKLGPMANRQAESGKGLFTLFFQPNSKEGEAEKRKKKKGNKTVNEDNSLTKLLIDEGHL